MISAQIDDSELPDHLEQTRMNIMNGLRVGMREIAQGLAWSVADKLQGNPIVSRSGRLLGAVLGSAKVTETETYIKATVSGNVNGKPRGLWLEEGTSVPAVAGVLYQFAPADGKSIFRHGHGAFQVGPHPFLNPSLEAYKPTIMDIINKRIAEACEQN